MTPEASRPRTARFRRALGPASLLGAACLAWSLATFAQNPAPGHAAVKASAEQGVRWSELKAAQQATLKPLEHEWSGIPAQRKLKWIELAERYPKMAPAEQQRISARMAEWVRMTPQERSQARLNFQEAKQLPLEDRQARWNAYQALTPEQKQQLAARAAPEPPRKSATHGDKAHDLPQPKSNLVTNPSFEARPTPLSPTLVQARPGASTTLITKRPNPPAHQQTGLPKIAATPGFVNKTTLLPQRGPQGAATQPVAVTAPEPAPHR